VAVDADFPQPQARPGAGGRLAALEHALSGEARPWCKDGTPASDCPAEHPSLRFLRRYSNYTPKLGLLSGDSLAAISTYLRNLLLNQLILVAFFGALLTLPYLLLYVGHQLVHPQGFALNTRWAGPRYPCCLPGDWPAAGCRAGLRNQPDAVSHGRAPSHETSRLHPHLHRLPALSSAWLLALTLYGHAGAVRVLAMDLGDVDDVGILARRVVAY